MSSQACFVSGAFDGTTVVLSTALVSGAFDSTTVVLHTASY
jgi:hypothetical protein